MGTKRMVIVNTANHPWAVIDSAQLAATWSDVSIEELYFSPTKEPFWGDTNAEPVQVMPDEDLLHSKLVAMDPDSVYLRVSPHTQSEYLVATIRAILRDTRLIVEFYDTSMQFSPEALLRLHGNRSENVGMALKGCEVAVTEADALVVKMGGDAFEEWKRVIKTPVISFFPSLSSTPCRDTKVPGASRHVVYAGTIVGANSEAVSVGRAPNAYLDRIVESSSCKLTVINAAHGAHAGIDHSEVRNRYERPHRHSFYLPRTSRSDLIAAFMSKYDVGICCGHNDPHQIGDAVRSRLPNRMMTYIEAGLPVVIEDAFQYAAKFIKDYDAGAVIPTGEFNALPNIIMTLPLILNQSGVSDLKSMMISKNLTALYDLKRRLFGDGLTSPNKH